MTLSAGTRIGPYEVRDAIGEGRMGQVYRVHDARLNRDGAPTSPSRCSSLPRPPAVATSSPPVAPALRRVSLLRRSLLPIAAAAIVGALSALAVWLATRPDGDALRHSADRATRAGSLMLTGLRARRSRPATASDRLHRTGAGDAEEGRDHRRTGTTICALDGPSRARPGGGRPDHLYHRDAASPDGKRFLVIKEAASLADAPPVDVVVVRDWFHELKRLVPRPR